MKFVSIVSFLFLSLSVSAQNLYHLSGKVLDGVTGEPLQGAVVRIMDNGNTWTLANDRGVFQLVLPGGDHLIEVSYIGYKPDQFQMKAEKDFETVFFLTPLSYILQSVTVFAESPEMRLRKPEMSVERIDARLVQRVPTLFGEVDLIKVIQMLPGVQAASEGSSGFIVRGGSPDQNMILFDNATLYNVSHMLGFFSIFNNDAVGNMTLYKGDIPARFGGRLSSLLDVEPADGSPGFAVNGGVGLISSKLSVQGRIGTDNFTYLLAGRRTYADLFLPLAKQEVVRDATIHFYDLNGRLRWKVNDNNYINLTLYNGMDRFAISKMGVTFGNSMAALNWNHTISPRLYLKTHATYTYYAYDFAGSTEQLDLNWVSNIKDAGMRVDFSFIPDKLNQVDFGFTSNFQWFVPGTAIGSAALKSGATVEQDISMSPRQSLVNVLYFSNEHKLFNQVLQLRYGLRFTRFDNVGPTILYEVDENYELINEEGVEIPRGKFFYHQYGWEPRLGLSVLVSPDISLKLAYARTLQYVHLLSFSSAGSPLEIWIPSSPSVKPQSSQQFSTGVFSNLFDGQWEFSAELFYKYLDNVLDFKEHPNLLLYDKIETELRFGTGRSYGAEFLIRKNGGRYYGWISYTYSRAFRTVPGVNDGKSYRAPSDRPHNISLVASYDLSKRIQVSMNWIYSTGQPLTLAEGRYWFFNELIPVYTARNSYRMPDYHRMDLSVLIQLGKPGRKWQNSLNISVYNLYGRKNPWAVNYRMKTTGEQYLEMTYLFGIVPSVSWNFSF